MFVVERKSDLFKLSIWTQLYLFYFILLTKKLPLPYDCD